MAVTARIEVTRYYIRGNKVEEETGGQSGVFTVVDSSTRKDERWLYLDGGPYSMPIDERSIEHTSKDGWLAQAPTKPVYDPEEGWGGRNYPRIFVPAESMRLVWAALNV